MDSESPSGKRALGLRRDPRMLLFVESARQYVELIDTPPIDIKAWVKSLHQALSELYSAAIGLRTIESFEAPDSNLESFEVSHAEWRTLYHRLCTLLGHDAWYWMYFEPMKTQVEKAEPVGGNLADDLADVYRDVAAGLRAWDSTDDSPLDEVVFEWIRGGFEIHWGAHAVDALGILHRVVTDRVMRDPGSGA
jgi:hypothetical protein